MPGIEAHVRRTRGMSWLVPHPRPLPGGAIIRPRIQADENSEVGRRVLAHFTLKAHRDYQSFWARYGDKGPRP